jgi:hypothetical protein
VLQARLGVRLLNSERVQPPTWTSMLPLGSLVAVAVLLASVLLGVTVQGGLVALAVFLLTNRPRLLTLWHFSVQKLVKVS